MSNQVIRNYQCSREQAFTACVQAIQGLGYKIGRSDQGSGLITFQTGMSLWTWQGQEMSVALMHFDNGVTSVTIQGQMRRTGINFQVVDWGEGQRICEKVAGQLDLVLQPA